MADDCRIERQIYCSIMQKLTKIKVGTKVRSVIFSSEFERQYFDICTQVYSAIYVPFCSTNFGLLWFSFFILSSQNISFFLGKELVKIFLLTYGEFTFFFPLRQVTRRYKGREVVVGDPTQTAPISAVSPKRFVVWRSPGGNNTLQIG